MKPLLHRRHLHHIHQIGRCLFKNYILNKIRWIASTLLFILFLNDYCASFLWRLSCFVKLNQRLVKNCQSIYYTGLCESITFVISNNLVIFFTQFEQKANALLSTLFVSKKQMIISLSVVGTFLSAFNIEISIPKFSKPISQCRSFLAIFNRHNT